MRFRHVLLAMGLASCGPTDRGYIIHMEVIGVPGSFTGRSIEISGVAAEAAVPKTGEMGVWTTEVTLWPQSREAFLPRPIRIRVTQGSQVLTDEDVHRVACGLSRTPAGDEEHNIVYLEADGSVSADFGNDARTLASCYPPNHPL